MSQVTKKTFGKTNFTVFLTLVAVFFFSAQTRGEADVDVCYVKTSSGETFSLNKLCSGNRQSVNLVTIELNPRFVTRDKSGAYWVELGAPQAFKLPTGHTIYPNGIIVDPSGFQFQPIIRNGNAIGMQYFRRNGSPASPGEILTLPNGQTVQQLSY